MQGSLTTSYSQAFDNAALIRCAASLSRERLVASGSVPQELSLRENKTMHDPNGIYDLHAQLNAVRLRLRWFLAIDHYKVTDEQAQLMLRERELLARLNQSNK